MGLDNIWQLPDGVDPPKFGQLNICGGMMSGPNPELGICTSFRGKVYSDFIQEITGFTLYEDTLDTEDLGSLVISLNEFRDELHSFVPGYRLLIFINTKFDGVDKNYVCIGIDSLEDLILMFSTYANIEGASLKSWY